MKAILVALVVLVAGCVTRQQWTHPTKEYQSDEWHQDLFACQRAAMPMVGIEGMNITRTCMRARGWREK